MVLLKYRANEKVTKQDSHKVLKGAICIDPAETIKSYAQALLALCASE